MWLWIGGLAGLVVLGWAAWRLTAAITDRGGERGGRADRLAVQSIAQLLAFSGKRSAGRPFWDGEERMKGFQGNDGAIGG